MRHGVSVLTLEPAVLEAGGFGLLEFTEHPVCVGSWPDGGEGEGWLSRPHVVMAVFCLCPQVSDGRLW